MSGGLTTYTKNKIISHALGKASFTAPGAVYLALGNADFTTAATTGVGAELIAASYSRVAITFGAPVAGVITSTAVAAFTTATESWGTDILYWAIFDHATKGNGNCLAYGKLNSVQTIALGNTASISDTGIVFDLAGEVTDAFTALALNMVFRAVPWTMPVAWSIGLKATSNILTTDTGAVDGGTLHPGAATGSYDRFVVSATDWGTVASGSVTNVTEIAFDAALDALWGTQEGIFVANSASRGAGTILFYDNSISQAVGLGDQIVCLPSNFTITLTSTAH